jgi:drug/metabolite transporter (DMT)-like permease
MTSVQLLGRLASPVFVVIWATGFIVARLVAPYAEPLSFLVFRYALAILILAAIAFLAGARWPNRAMQWRDALLAGVLLHGFYLGGVFWAVRHGLPAGIAALIAGLQPLATGLLVGPLLGEEVSPRRWAGIALGFLGALLVIAPKLGVAGGFPPVALAICLLAMASITLGTIWQKRTGGGIDMRVNAIIQYLGAMAATLPLALLTERFEVTFAWQFWAGLLWAVCGLSIGAIGLLLFLIRRGAVAGVAALLYLVPPVSAMMAYFAFGETLGLLQIAGMAVAAGGVALASRG